MLYEACKADGRVTLESGREVTGLTDLGASAQASFADGTSYVCGAVIGADGLWSVARTLVSDDRPRSDAFVAYRGTLPAYGTTLLTTRETTPAGPEDEVIWIGPHKHFVQYPIRPGELYNQVAVFRSKIHAPDGEPPDSRGTPAELDEGFAAACDPVRTGVALVSRDRRWVMYDRDPLDNWTTGRITLLGDAAHPMVQYLAQGACQAIEDADCLARQLVACDGDVVKGLAAYQAERIPRTAQVQRAARTWGEIWHDDGAVIPLLRDRILTQRDPGDYTDLDWLYQDQRGDGRRREAS